MPKILQNASECDLIGKISFSKASPNAAVAFILPVNQPIDRWSMPNFLQNASDRDLHDQISFSKAPPNAAVAFILLFNQRIDP